MGHFWAKFGPFLGQLLAQKWGRFALDLGQFGPPKLAKKGVQKWAQK